MTPFDVRSSLEQLAEEIPTGPARSISDIANEALVLRRRRRTRWATLAAAAAVAAVALVVPLAVDNAEDRPAPANPPADDTPSQDVDVITQDGECTLDVATSTDYSSVLLVRTDCTVKTIEADWGPTISYTSLSPDGTTVAAAIPGEPAHLELLNLRTGKRQTLASATDALGDPTWSRDGRFVAFWVNEGGASSIHVANVEDLTDRQISTAGTTAAFPAWSPDGSAVVFSRLGDLWMVDVATGSERQLPDAPRHLSHPFWGINNGEGLYAIDSGSNTGSRGYRVVQLDPTTGEVVASSQEIQGGSIQDAMYDGFGIHIATINNSRSTVVTTLDYNLSAIGQRTVPDAYVTNLRERQPSTTAPEGTTPDGRTYGPAATENPPDLIAVLTIDDHVGYLPIGDENEPSPGSPEEALIWHERMRAHRYPVYAIDGTTIVGVFDIAGGGPRSSRIARLTTSTTPPPTAEKESLTGDLRIDNHGCTYLTSGATEHWLIWPWEFQLVDPHAKTLAIENFVENTPVASNGDQITIEGLRLPGQEVQGGPCATDTPRSTSSHTDFTRNQLRRDSGGITPPPVTAGTHRRGQSSEVRLR